MTGSKFRNIYYMALDGPGPLLFEPSEGYQMFAARDQDAMSHVPSAMIRWRRFYDSKRIADELATVVNNFIP